MNKYVCIHSHFYQPPRENPWLEEIEVQDSAYPYRDWNERITAECYNPNTAARILINNDTIIGIVNNYKKISFNFGPTLLSWMEKSAPYVYSRIQEADKDSLEIFSGHGSAIAQVYNHMIMPLSNSRDKETQIIWGKQDFIHRFNREPEGMWLAETAVDIESLELLAGQGIKFTILAPRQAAKVKKIGENEWFDVADESIDPRRCYNCLLPSGNSIAVFFYDGNIARDLAFGDLMSSGENFSNRLLSSISEPDQTQIANIATDGETYGHHQKNGDMALAYCLNIIQESNFAKITVYGEFLELHPPEWEVQIIENTSWSCIHGVERWKSNCGCNAGHQGWNQDWRAPLRSSLDWLRDSLIDLYREEASRFTPDVWKLRNDFIHIILNRNPENIERIFNQNNISSVTPDQKVKLLKLLEMQRHAMLMYTSCGWFFDEISGIESVQLLQYAARTIQLAKEINGNDLEPEFINHLKEIKSNLPEIANGENIYNRYVKPASVDLLRVAAHYAVTSLFEDTGSESEIFSYKVTNEQFQKYEAGKNKMVIGKVKMYSKITFEETDVSFAFVYLGVNNLNGGVSGNMEQEAYDLMKSEMESAFEHLDIAQIILCMDKHFGGHGYSLKSIFKDKKREIFSKILVETQENIEHTFRQIYENHYSTLLAMKDVQIPVPKSLLAAVEETINSDLKKAFEAWGELDTEKIQNLINEVHKWEISVDKEKLALSGTNRVTRLMKLLQDNPEDSAVLYEIIATLKNLYELNINLDLWEAQNIFYLLSEDIPEIKNEQLNELNCLLKIKS